MMRAVCIKRRISNFSAGVYSFHVDLFHGTACEPVAGASCASLPIPLRLERSGTVVPPVFSPDWHLIVCDSVYAVLKNIPFLSFGHVTFERLYDYWIEPFDKSYEELIRGEFRDVLDKQWGREMMVEDGQDVFLEQRPDVPSLHARIGKYYELQCPSWQAITALAPSTNERQIEIDDETMVVRTNRELLLKHPVLPSLGGWVLRFDVFDVIKSYLDARFFAIAEFDA